MAAVAAAQSEKQQTVKPSTSTTLSVEVENGKSLKLTPADLAKLPRKEIKAKDHDGKDTTYSGVELREILILADAKLGKDLRGPMLAGYLTVEAADGYKAVFGIAELDGLFTDKSVILADAQDAKPLSDHDGPWQIIVPDEKKHGRWVRQVTALKLRFVK